MCKPCIKKFRKVLHEFKLGKLKTHGKSVKSMKQALAIAYSEKRKQKMKS